MSWTSLAHAAFAVAVFYLLWWLYSLEQRLGSIERTSKTDPLTGLGSATWLESERWYAALRSGRPLCVAWFDLDGLKRRNDQSGHAAGDQLIRAAARALTLASRRGVDEVFRLHTRGDEFLVLLHGPLDPARLADKFRQELHRQGVSASGGLAYSTELGYLPARVELRAQAEAACRRAKEQGGDCVWVATVGGSPLSATASGKEPAHHDPQSAAIPEPIAEHPAVSAYLQGARR
jgi:diguanylate cyclase (GGDEF)-like protein